MNLKEKILENEELTKIVSAILMFVLGLILVGTGILLSIVNEGFGFFVGTIGVILGFVGAIPLIDYWIRWHSQ